MHIPLPVGVKSKGSITGYAVASPFAELEPSEAIKLVALAPEFFEIANGLEIHEEPIKKKVGRPRKESSVA